MADTTHIAAIDDDPDMLALINRYLGDAGFTVHTFQDPALALEKMGSLDLSAILLDLELPGTSGTEVCTKLRGIPALKDIPVIFLSAASDGIKVAQALISGANDYVTKPFHTQELCARIETHVLVRQQQRKLLDQREVLEKRNHENIILSTQAVMLQEIIKQYLPRSTWEKADLSAAGGMHEIPDETVDLAILFLDVSGFTSFSENRGAKEVIQALNDLLGPITDLLMRNTWDIDKFIGDSIFATSADPLAAVKGALAARDSAIAVNKKREEKGESVLHVRMGINYGRVVRGNVGSQSRKENTIIGDAVNTASRIERACQPGKVLISGSFFGQVESRVEASAPIMLKAKGKERTVPVHYLRSLRP